MAIGAKVFTLCEAPLTTVNTPADGTAPPIFHPNVKASESASDPFAVKLMEDVRATEFPTATGVCEAQVGAVFFVTVHERVTVLVPLVTVANKVLLPAFKVEDKISTVLLVVPTLEPFNCQVVEQLASLGITLNGVKVEPRADTLSDAVLGELEVTEQSF